MEPDHCFPPVNQLCLYFLLQFQVQNVQIACRFLKRFHLFIFRERGREGEKEEEKHQCVVASQVPPTSDMAHTQACALTGSRTGNALVFRLSLNPLSYTSQGR